jgi:hypothetical protein
MAKKRVEKDEQIEQPVLEEGAMMIDDSFEDIPMKEVPVEHTVQEPKETPAQRFTAKAPEYTINCLRNEKVIVRFLPSQSAMVHQAGHVLDGGMAENATRTYVVPRLKSGIYKNVLTNAEKACLEEVMQLEPNALSIHRKTNNFWDDSNDQGVNKVVLHKHDNVLDLSNPVDYIKYKILLANDDLIAPSHEAVLELPKATYQFEIIHEQEEAKEAAGGISIMQKCFAEYGKIENDADTLRTIIEIFTRKSTSANTKLPAIQKEIFNCIQKDDRYFLKIITDPMLRFKTLIVMATEAGILAKKNDGYYYLMEDGRPLCELNENSTLDNAAKYLSNPKRQDLLFRIEGKLK